MAEQVEMGGVAVARRELLAIGAAAITGETRARSARPTSSGRFLWGAATAAHQIEGGNVNSDYWVLEHIRDTSWSEPSGDACDSLNRWREDLALVRATGLNAYRFSIEWARIEPERGQFSRASLDYYRRICAAYREAGITPMITFHHFTSPRWVAGLGGWENPDIADHLARYCEQAAKALGDLVEWACTINEPNGQVNSFIMAGERSPEKEAMAKAEAAQAIGSDRFSAFFQGNGLMVRDHCIAAHAKATAAIKSAAPHVKTGMTLALQDLKQGPGGERLYRRLWEQSRVPFYQATSSDDFLGVQPYNRMVVGADGYLPTPSGVLKARSGADASPDVLGAVLDEAHAHCRAPLIVTENGLDTEDDALRIRHLTATLSGMEERIAAGVPVLGYFHWSLLDNFEWSSGYKPKFGLYACDRQSFRRVAKPSAAAYRALIATIRRRRRWA